MSKIITYIPDPTPKEPCFQFSCYDKTLDVGPTGTHFGGGGSVWLDGWMNIKVLYQNSFIPKSNSI